MGKNSHLSSTKSLLCAAASALAIASAVPAPAQAQAPTQTPQDITLPAAPLGQAILALGRELGVNIIAPDRLVRGKSAPAISGTLTGEQAIDRLLAGSGLIATANANGDFILSEQVAAGAPRVQLISNDSASIEPLITETIVVTGSRIKRTAINSPAPIDIVTAEDIAKLGLTDTTEALRFVPALNQSTSLTARGDFAPSAISGFGAATLDLRGLGTSRTLTLVDGRRHVSGVSGQATVDVSSIPAALIDRLEVLTGGGSSIYGADAVSGVVNYILKDDFEGVDVRANGSLPTRGGGEAYFGSITLGGNYAGGRGNAVLSVEDNRQTSLEADQRIGTRFRTDAIANTPEVAEFLGVSPDFVNVRLSDARFIIPPSPTFTFLGSLFAVGPTFIGGTAEIGGVPVEQIVDQETGQVRPREFGDFLSGFVTNGGDNVRETLINPVSTSIPDVERTVVNAIADYDFTNAITGFVEVKYSHNSSQTVPSFLFQSFDLPISQENPFLPQIARDQFASLTAQNLDPNLVVSRLFYDDIGVAPVESTRETFRIVGGFEGDITENLSYQISVNYGRTDTQLVNNRAVLPDRFYAALDAIPDPETGEPICRSDIDPNTLPPTSFAPFLSTPRFRSFTPGDGSCVPLDIFAVPNGLLQESLDFLLERTVNEVQLEQFVVNGVVTGNTEQFLRLPAGAIGYAAGFEYREERSDFRPDALENAGLTELSPDALTGKFDVFEGFAEVNVPILSNTFLAKSLTLDASVRIADYSTVGTAKSFGFGSVWQPIDDLRIRGSFNRAIRAPNIAELFSPQRVVQGSLQLNSDPCDPESRTTGSATRAQNCAQLVPDPATFDPAQSYAFQGVTFTSGGNPILQEETADTWSIGFAFTPSALPGLTVIADYYSIRIKNAVSQGLNANTIVLNCADAPSIDNGFCDAITRNTVTGVVEAVQTTALNVSASRAKGIDYQVSYDFTLDNLVSGDWGDFNVQLTGTYLISREDELFADFPETNDRLDGEYNFPKHFINAALSWNSGPWSAVYNVNFQSNQVFRNAFVGIGIEELEENPLLLDRPNSGSAFVHTIGGAFQVAEAVELSLRVNNLFDRNPFELRPFGPTIRPTGLLGRTVQLCVQATF